MIYLKQANDEHKLEPMINSLCLFILCVVSLYTNGKYPKRMRCEKEESSFGGFSTIFTCKPNNSSFTHKFPARNRESP